MRWHHHSVQDMIAKNSRFCNFYEVKAAKLGAKKQLKIAETG